MEQFEAIVAPQYTPYFQTIFRQSDRQINIIKDRYISRHFEIQIDRKKERMKDRYTDRYIARLIDI